MQPPLFDLEIDIQTELTRLSERSPYSPFPDQLAAVQSLILSQIAREARNISSRLNNPISGIVIGLRPDPTSYKGSVEGLKKKLDPNYSSNKSRHRFSEMLKRSHMGDSVGLLRAFTSGLGVDRVGHSSASCCFGALKVEGG